MKTNVPISIGFDFINDFLSLISNSIESDEHELNKTVK